MSCKIIKQCERKTHTEFRLEFWNDHLGGGYSFPCDINGNVFDDMAPEAKANLDWCLCHPEKFNVWNEVKKESWSYIEPARAKCICGVVFDLTNEYDGACECPKCGKWYNIFGQELINPEYWEDEDDEM